MAKNILYTDNSSMVRRELPLSIKRAAMTIGLQAERYAKEYLKNQDAVDTGLLRNSVTFAIGGEAPHVMAYQASKKPKDGKDKAAGAYTGAAPTDAEHRVSVYIGTNVEYGRYVEFGTSRGMKPRPFIKPTMLEHAEEYKEILKTELST